MENRESVINYINNLKGYQGFVQFSDTKIRECDIFKEFQDIKLTTTKGFIYEAHFYNGKDSITIKQVNNNWLVDKIENTPLDDIQIYHTKFSSEVTASASLKGGAKAPLPKILTVKMAQIWEAKPDDLCEGMEVMKLQKVVFVGFDNG